MRYFSIWLVRSASWALRAVAVVLWSLSCLSSWSAWFWRSARVDSRESLSLWRLGDG